MPQRKTEVVKFRCTPEDKALFERVAEADPDADSLSRWMRLQLRVGAQIAESNKEDN